MKGQSRLNMWFFVLTVVIMTSLILTGQCEAQVLTEEYRLVEMTLMDLDKDSKPDIVLISFALKDTVDRVLIYSISGEYYGYMQLEDGVWYAYYPDGTSKKLGTKEVPIKERLRSS